MGILFGIVIALAVVSVLIFKTLARRSFKKNREPQSLSDMYVSLKDQVSSEVFNEVWLKIGESYSIDPQLIRPTDTLQALSDLDSWDLGKGDDALNLWLEHEHLGSPPVLENVLDLAKWIQVSRTRKS